ALLLRFFEYKSLREVGMELGFSEDAAQKRVSRALEDLREYFSKRKISVGAAGLAALLSVHGVQAAPFGLAAVIAAGSTAGASALSSSTAFAATKTIAMTTLQKTVVTSAATIAIAVGIYQAAQVSNLRTQIETLRSQEERQQVASSNELHALRMERDQATNALAAISSHNIRKGPDEVLHLRGEVGRLQREKEEIGAASPLSKVTANPQFRNAMRDQQKQAMTMVYAGFAKLNKLGPEQTEKLDNLLADDIMENVDLVTTSLRDKPSADQLNQIFAGQEAALQQKVQELLGPEAAAQFQDYTKNLFSTISSEQFKGELSGDDASRNAKAKQLAALIQQQVQTALAASGLSPDYQVVPMLNFRNIASQDLGDQSLALMDTIYQQTISQASSFLSADELEKFRKFVATALNNNRNALTLNRSLMAPLSN
ncbi:MAG TPA: hypothetical protein VHH88_02005, partial [Verrucomicrobiae bacterium]|nr:hypothetical protein [Verrucomicrobiae bacterium]